MARKQHVPKIPSTPIGPATVQPVPKVMPKMPNTPPPVQPPDLGPFEIYNQKDSFSFEHMDNAVLRETLTYEQILQAQAADRMSVNKAREILGLKPKPEDKNTRARILNTAEKLINGDRADLYGPPQVSFGRIGELLSAMGFRRLNEVNGNLHKLDAVDVALALVQLKISRILSSPEHEDSWIDAAGYVALGAEMALFFTPEEFQKREAVAEDSLPGYLRKKSQ